MTANDIQNLAAGFVLGIVGAALTWWLTTRMYRPEFDLSLIARSFDPKEPESIDYRFKVLNKRSRRAITDLDIQCRVFIQGLNPDANRKKNFTSFHIPVGDGKNFPYLDKAKGRIYRLRLEELEGGRTNRLPEGTLNKIQSGQYSLENLLRISGQKAYVRIAVTGADGFSGFRHSESAKWTIREIVPGTFKHSWSTEILRNNDLGETPMKQGEQDPAISYADERAGPEEDLEDGEEDPYD